MKPLFSMKEFWISLILLKVPVTTATKRPSRMNESKTFMSMNMTRVAGKIQGSLSCFKEEHLEYMQTEMGRSIHESIRHFVSGENRR